MSNEELVTFYQSLNKYGNEDFASWAVIKVMEGMDADAANLWREFSLSQYQEKHFIKPKTSSLDAPIDETDADSRTLHEVLADTKSAEVEGDDFDPEREIDMVEVKTLALQLMPERERFLIQLREAGVKKVRAMNLAMAPYRKGKRNRLKHEIGWNASHMAFKRYDAMLAAAYAMKLREMVGDKTQVDTRLEVQWLTMP